MIQLAYVSSTPTLLTESEISDILRKSRHNNAQHHITGLLVYHDGNVLQFLEGDEAAVARLFAKISADPRHRGIIKLYDNTIAERDFPNWSMGFTDVAPELRTTDGYSAIMERSFDLRTLSPTKARQLLRMFKTCAGQRLP